MKKIVMTSPESFGVTYNINPWMEGNIGQTQSEEATRQWTAVKESLKSAGAEVTVMESPPADCPDAVFVANAGVVLGKKFLPSRFKYEQRAAEEPYFTSWFRDAGYEIVEPDYSCSIRENLAFEGAGDALFNIDRSDLWYGIGFRGTYPFSEQLHKIFKSDRVTVKVLAMVNPSFYHLDTCFCPLDTGELLWYPDAFSEHSQKIIRAAYKKSAIEVSGRDAVAFACNAVSVGSAIVTSVISHELHASLQARGYEVYQCDVSQFLKSGGGCKCLTLELIE